MERDPVLRAHNVDTTEKNRCYDVSGYFNPISIKDQIIRICSIIDRAIAYQLISESRPLLIIGGGFAGVMAGIKAAENNIKSVLIEENKILSRFQQSVRYFSPVQYDWTAAHWKEISFPWHVSDSIPLKIGEGETRNVVALLKQKYVTAKRKHSGILFSHEKVIMKDFKFSAGGYPLLVPHLTRANGTPFKAEEEEFGMGISCTGFGSEIVFIGGNSFRGYEFWKLDKFDFADEGKTLICGSGDGALQDFLLFATIKNSAREIFESLDINGAILDKLEKEIAKAENKASKNSSWWDRKAENPKIVKTLCDLSTSLHLVFAEQVENLLDKGSSDIYKKAISIICRSHDLI